MLHFSKFGIRRYETHFANIQVLMLYNAKTSLPTFLSKYNEVAHVRVSGHHYMWSYILKGYIKNVISRLDTSILLEDPHVFILGCNICMIMNFMITLMISIGSFKVNISKKGSHPK